MKRYHILIIILLWATRQSSQAQNQFSAIHQNFEPVSVSLPYIGLDFLRDKFQDIIVQEPGGGGAWKNIARIKTYKQNNRYYDIGYYNFQEATQSWNVQIADQYKNVFNPSAQLELSAWDRHYTDPSLNIKNRCRIFYQSGRIDSIAYEKATVGQNLTFFNACKVHYNSSGKIDKRVRHYYSGEYFTEYVNYNTQGQVVNVLSMDHKVGQAKADSSSLDIYEYDAQGRLSRYSGKIYNGSLWRVVNKTEYEYDAAGRISTSRSWYISNTTNKLELYYIYNYTYTSAGKVEGFREWKQTFNTPDTSDVKIVFNYNGNSLLDGLEYSWNGTAYDSIPQARYLFHEELPLALENAPKSASLQIYPNPLQSFMYFGKEQSGSFRIYDLSGRMIREWTSNKPVKEVYVGDLEKGAYILLVNDDMSTRFIKE